MNKTLQLRKRQTAHKVITSEKLLLNCMEKVSQLQLNRLQIIMSSAAQSKRLYLKSIQFAYMQTQNCLQYCVTYNTVTGSTSSYLSELLHLYTPSRSLRSSSRVLKLPCFDRVGHGFLALRSSHLEQFTLRYFRTKFKCLSSPDIPYFT